MKKVRRALETMKRPWYNIPSVIFLVMPIDSRHCATVSKLPRYSDWSEATLEHVRMVPQVMWFGHCYFADLGFSTGKVRALTNFYHARRIAPVITQAPSKGLLGGQIAD